MKTWIISNVFDFYCIFKLESKDEMIYFKRHKAIVVVQTEHEKKELIPTFREFTFIYKNEKDGTSVIDHIL